MADTKRKKSLTNEKIQKKLKAYNSRINQLKTIQLRRQTELNLILNDPEAWIRSQKFGKYTNVQQELKKRKETLSAKNARLDLLIMKAEGGKITQGMFDYSRGKLKGKGDKSLIESFNLVKPDGSSYAVGDTYIPTDNDRFTLIDNLQEVLDQREIAEADNTSNFPTVTITDPNNKYKTIEIDQADYYGGTDFRNEQTVIDSALLKLIQNQKTQMENNESKIDLTKELTIGDF
tara:strand:+ start:45 stop:743 length:699 start_codon:yes stop_codon:yes gene_type:complete